MRDGERRKIKIYETTMNFEIYGTFWGKFCIFAQ